MDLLEEEIKRRTCALWRLSAFESFETLPTGLDTNDDDQPENETSRRARYDDLTLQRALRPS